MRRRHLAALLVAPVLASLPFSGAGAPSGGEALAQEAPTLRLTATEELSPRAEGGDGQLSWADVPGEMEVEFVPGDALPMERVPVQLVALAVRGGEVVGRSSTTPSVVSAGESLPASRLAGESWPAAGDLFGTGEWNPVDVGVPDDPVPADAEAVASAVSPPSDGAAVVLFAVPAAAELAERFRTLPLAVAAERASDPADTDTTTLDAPAEDETGD